MGFADLFPFPSRESPRRLRRKDPKVGEKFDDYLVHAPRRVVEPSRANLPQHFHPKQRSFDRPRSQRGPVSWKRTASAPRSISALHEHHVKRLEDKPRSSATVHAPRLRSNLSLMQQSRHAQLAPSPPPPSPRQFDAPNEKPVSANRPYVAKKSTPKKRPPALRTSGLAHGFAASGLPRELTPTPMQLGHQQPSASSCISPASMSTPNLTLQTHQSQPSQLVQPSQPSQQFHPSQSSLPSQPPSRPRSRTLSNARSSRSNSRMHSDRSSNSLGLKETTDNDSFSLDETFSLSSLGEAEYSSAVAAKNGIFPADRSPGQRLDPSEACEDFFVFGTEGVFTGGGFVISREGMIESPGNLTRKQSNGAAVDGVPKSSNNFIFVQSLAEFSRASTLSRRTKVDSTLGTGAAGRVSLAIHRPSNRKIAVKRINVYDENKRNQLLKELDTLMRYESRFLVRSYGAFYDGEGVVHVTLEYMDRGALSDIVETRGKLPERFISHIAEHCLRGLLFLHENHVLHRDLKTSNILLSRRACRAKLSDFGLARDLSPGVSKADSFVGTLAYMSPERLHGSDYTYASDIWGLGISVLECYLGKYPFDKPQSYFNYIDAAQSNPSSRMVEASPECVDFVHKCTRADPLERPTAAELLQHPWIVNRGGDVNAFREWLQDLPETHSGELTADEPAFAQNALKRIRDMDRSAT